MACGGLALWAVYSERFKQYRVRTPVRDPLPVVPRYINIAMNLTLSLAIYFAVLYVGAEYLFYDAMPGLALFFGAALVPLFLGIAVVGPISVASLLSVLVVHAFVNIVVHNGLVLPHPAFRLTNYWVIRHDRHHDKHVNTNFAQVFSFWDMMFGTHK